VRAVLAARTMKNGGLEWPAAEDLAAP
jgi:hypothetical protein